MIFSLSFKDTWKLRLINTGQFESTADY